MDRQTDNQQAKINDLDLGWLIGLIDGEGCFAFAQRKHKKVRGKIAHQITPLITIVNQSLPALDKSTLLLTKLGIGHYVQWQQSRRRNGVLTRKTWVIWISGFMRVKKAISLIGSYLIIKKQQADLLMEFINSRIPKAHSGERNGSESYSEDELNMPIRMHRLNHHP